MVEVMEQNYRRIFAFFLENMNYFKKLERGGAAGEVSHEGETVKWRRPAATLGGSPGRCMSFFENHNFLGARLGMNNRSVWYRLSGGRIAGYAHNKLKRNRPTYCSPGIYLLIASGDTT